MTYVINGSPEQVFSKSDKKNDGGEWLESWWLVNQRWTNEDNGNTIVQYGIGMRAALRSPFYLLDVGMSTVSPSLGWSCNGSDWDQIHILGIRAPRTATASLPGQDWGEGGGSWWPDGVLPDKQQLQQPGADWRVEVVEGVGVLECWCWDLLFLLYRRDYQARHSACAGAEYKYENPVLAALDLQNPRHSHAGRSSRPQCSPPGVVIII